MMSENNNVVSTLNWVIDWLQERIKERTSWDGFTIIVISVLVLSASPLLRYAAWAGLVYGAWTLWKKESWNPFSTAAAPASKDDKK
jgi:hypothetical protein